MNFPERVARAFEAQGLLANLEPALTVRVGQVHMAKEVARTIDEGGVLAVEAGTGVGKTFAYLVPALLSGKRTLLSTATKTLQDQLYNRDIPRLLTALKVPVRVALLKGRSSYLCLQRLGEARQHLNAQDFCQHADLAQVEIWAMATRSGDLSELGSLDENSPVLPLVTSTRENCLGSTCPQAGSCHINQARRTAKAADIVVINHHLFFADLHVRESGVAELLPTVSTVVFDEAHQLNDVGIQFLARQWSTHQVEVLCRELEHQGPLLAMVSTSWRSVVFDIVHAVAALRGVVGETVEGRLPWSTQAPLGLSASGWNQCLMALHSSLRAAIGVLSQLQDHEGAAHALRLRVVSLFEDVSAFSEPADPGVVRWLEIGKSVRLLQSPLHIADALRPLLLGTDTGLDRLQPSWVFTSATLGHDATLAWFITSCGLTNARVLRVDSPFDYAAQAVLYVPTHCPRPSDPMHSECVAMLAAQGAEILGGRTLVLTTSLRAMCSIGEALRQHFTEGSRIDVLVQGELSKRELTDRFCRAPREGTRGNVLVASASFWEGIDVPGDALQMVVIDKLPFAPPDDPLVEARSRALKLIGKNPFQHLHVPHAAVALKQGAGRLIRSETDRGVLLICDSRLVQNGYGRKIMAALPPMRRAMSQEQFLEALTKITKTSTTNPDLP